VPRIVREADATWEGTLARGNGTLTAASSATFAGLPITLASRLEVHQGKTSPEELLAAAHAACYITSLAGELARARTPPARLAVCCIITMDEVEGGNHRIVASAIDATAWVPGADQDLVSRVGHIADRDCPFSALIRGTAEVSVDVTLGEEE
jgi:osmotically inducible protein OsmC